MVSIPSLENPAKASFTVTTLPISNRNKAERMVNSVSNHSFNKTIVIIKMMAKVYQNWKFMPFSRPLQEPLIDLFVRFLK